MPIHRTRHTTPTDEPGLEGMAGKRAGHRDRLLDLRMFSHGVAGDQVRIDQQHQARAERQGSSLS